MQLIGQFDSPYVRRVAVALSHYGISFEHRPWSVWADAELLRTVNPVGRVPALVLDDGEVLIESSAILDHLDETVGDDRVLLPKSGPIRRDGLRVCALATGLADKAVSLYLERVLEGTRAAWVARCETQITEALDSLERDLSRRTTPWWIFDRMSHADTTVACALRFTWEAAPDRFDPKRTPLLKAHATRCEALPEFQLHQQPVTVVMRR